MNDDALNMSLISDYEPLLLFAHDLLRVQIQLRHTYEDRREIGLDNYNPLAFSQLPENYSHVFCNHVPRRNAKERMKSWAHKKWPAIIAQEAKNCLLYTSPSPRDRQKSRMPSSA